MKAANLFVLSMLVLTAISCGNKKTAGEELPYFIDLENVANNTVEANLSQIASEITYIPLETSDLSLLRNIREIVFFNHAILVSDYTNLYQFDQSGKFIKKIGTVGEGPADYTYINSVLSGLDGSKFYLFTTAKINVYNSNAEYIQSISTRETLPRTFGAQMHPNGHFFVYLGGRSKLADDTTTIYSFAEMDMEGQVIHKIPNASPIIASGVAMITVQIPFYTYKNQIHYMDYMNDTLFSISPDGTIAPYAITHLGSMKSEALSPDLTQQQIKALSSKLSIFNMYEDDNFFSFQLAWGINSRKANQLALFEKATRKLIPVGGKGLRNDIDGAIPFFPDQIEADGSKIMSIQAADFKEQILSLDYDTQLAKYGDKFKKTWDLATQLNDDDNPVIVIAR